MHSDNGKHDFERYAIDGINVPNTTNTIAPRLIVGNGNVEILQRFHHFKKAAEYHFRLVIVWTVR